jgi:integrase/recombinase XerD
MGQLFHAPTTTLDQEIQEFLIDRQYRNLTAKTLKWYSEGLQKWRDFVTANGVQATADTKPFHIRRFLLHLQERGPNAGGVAGMYTTLRTFLVWYGREFAPDKWRSPLENISKPKRIQELQEPLDLGDFKKMLAAAKAKTRNGDRDRAILLFLLDSGVRQQELIHLNIGDVDLTSGQVLIRSGKGRKTRLVIVGARTRRAVIAWLRHRPDVDADAPFRTDRDNERLTKDGMRQVIRRLALRAGVAEPGLHDFRRAFAVSFLNNGGDVLTLQRILGHTNTAVTSRYVKLAAEDLRRTHAKASPVDNLKE